MKIYLRASLIFLSVLVFLDSGLCSNNPQGTDQISKKRKLGNVEDEEALLPANPEDSRSRKSEDSYISRIETFHEEDRLDVANRILTPHHEFISSSGSMTSTAHTPDISSELVHAPESKKMRKWRKEFMSAIQAGDLSRIRLLECECNDAHFTVTSRFDPSHFTYPLHFALHHKIGDVASFIIDNMSFDVNAADSFGHTPLSLALESEDYKSFVKLLEKSNLDTPVRGGLGLVHLAASVKTSSTLFLTELKQKGLDFKAVSGIRGWTPLQYAVIANNFTSTEWIAENTDCNFSYEKNATIILDAVKAGHIILADSLIEWGASVTCLDADGRNIFHIIAKTDANEIILSACSRCDVPGFFALQDYIKGYGPIHYAAEHDNVEFFSFFEIRFVLDSLTRDGKSFLEVAIDSASCNTIRYALSKQIVDLKHALRESYPSFLVHYYIKLEDKTNRIEVMSAILDHTPEKYHYLFDINGLNIVHHAVINNDLEMLRILKEKYSYDFDYLDNGEKDPDVNSPFSWAIYGNNLEIVKYFLNYEVNSKELVRICLFSPEEGPFACDPDDMNVFDLKELAEIFGGEEIKNLVAELITNDQNEI